MNLQKIHKISVIHTLFQSEEELLQFIFSHKALELRDSPEKLLKESRALSCQDQLLIQVAIDIWNGQGRTHLSNLLRHWQYEEWDHFIHAMIQLHGLSD